MRSASGSLQSFAEEPFFFRAHFEKNVSDLGHKLPAFFVEFRPWPILSSDGGREGNSGIGQLREFSLIGLLFRIVGGQRLDLRDVRLELVC